MSTISTTSTLLPLTLMSADKQEQAKKAASGLIRKDHDDIDVKFFLSHSTTFHKLNGPQLVKQHLLYSKAVLEMV